MYLKKYRWILLPILLCFSVWLLFHTLLFVGIVPSSSMEPTIPEDSIILGNRLIGNLGRGDIIVFRHGGKTLVKRIVAVGGDTVSLNDQDGSFAVNQELATATRILTVPRTISLWWETTARILLTADSGRNLLWARNGYWLV